MSKIKIVIIQRIFAKYRKPIFDLLVNKYELKVLHSYDNSEIPQIKTNYSEVVKSFRYGPKETNVYLKVLSQLIKFNPNIIIHEFNPSIISLHISFFYSKLFNKLFVVWGHGYNREKGFHPKHSFTAKVRYWYMKHSDAILVYGQETKKELSGFISEDKIFVAQNTLDTISLIQIRQDFEKVGITELKYELNIKHKYNIIYIGRLTKEKHPEYLIQLYHKFNKSFQREVAIHLIGAGEMYSKLKELITTEKLDNNIFLHGKITDPNINGKLLFISDLMVIPGALGLSIIHSFCFRKPVVSFAMGINGPFHGPEIEYIIQNRTGYLAQNYNLDDMFAFIIKYLQDNKLRKRMIKDIDQLIQNVASINNMEKGIADCINFVYNNYYY